MFLGEAALDRGLDVEVLGDVRILADQLACPARQLLRGRLGRLPEVDGAPAVGRLVRDPGLEAQALHLLEGVDRLVVQVAPELGDRRLRVGQVPEDEPDDHYRGGSFARSSLMRRSTSASS